MKIEYEATFANINKIEIRNKLKNLGAKKVRDEFLMKRIVFNLPTNERGTWIRVRDEGDKIMLAIKSIEGDGKNIEGQKELELQINDFKKGIMILEKIGCIKKSYQENKREIWILEDVEIAIDEWPFLEPFVEIEGNSEKEVKSIAEKLGFNYSNAIFSSTDEQYSAKYNLSEDRVVNKTPVIKFNGKNPFLKK
jgi:adenylate cyclase class 2